MEPRTFTGPDLGRLLTSVREAFGEDALVIRTRGPREFDGRNYEVLAAPPGSRNIETANSQVARSTGRHTIALVGPSGAGKTTTAIKLALHADAFGRRDVGLITLDTYRAAGVEQLGTYAEIAGLPLEVAYDAADMTRALDSLSDCDTIIIDTPARGLRGATEIEWRALLNAAKPTEVHLVIAATMRLDLAFAVREAHEWCGVTHSLITKLDEVPDRTGLRELRERLGLPIRWFTNGQEVPHDVFPAQGLPSARLAV
jgi:flagellar biosynthesis protein FlhF